MGLNCTEFYEAVEEGERVLAETDAGFGAICVAVFVVSAALLVDGERLVRPLGGLVGATVGAGAVLVFANDTGLPCEVQLAGAASPRCCWASPCAFSRRAYSSSEPPAPAPSPTSCTRRCP